jgi:protein SCO1
MKTKTMIAVLALGVALAAAAGGTWYFKRAAVENALIAAVEIGGPFRLAAAKGGMVDSADLIGKPYGVFFGYTHCPEVCPTTMYEMSRALATLGDEARDFRLFFITVDPERDTAPMLKDYLSNFDPRMEALVPTAAELPVVAREFRAIYAKVPTSDGSYTMDHTATVFLMGRDGKLVSTIRYTESPENRVAKLRRLVAGN